MDQSSKYGSTARMVALVTTAELVRNGPLISPLTTIGLIPGAWYGSYNRRLSFSAMPDRISAGWETRKDSPSPTCWETFTPRGEHGGPAFPGDIDTQQSVTGTVDGARWMPPECDVSIRPGWFWHASENDKVRTPDNLMDLYFKSVGRGASLLLNVPPDRRGRIHETDAANLREFGRRREAMFRTNLVSGARVRASNVRGNDRRFAAENLLDGDRTTYWTTDDNLRTADVVFELPGARNLQRDPDTRSFAARPASQVLFSRSRPDAAGAWKPLTSESSIGNCRLVRLESTAHSISAEACNYRGRGVPGSF